MKVLKIVFISLLVILLLAGVGLFIFIKTFDINRYKPQIIEEANKALGRELTLGPINLDISMKEGIRVRADKVALSDDPRYQTGTFLTVDQIFVGVDILGYLTRREIAITSILIQNPDVIVIKEKDGTLNVTTIGIPPTTSPSTSPTPGVGKVEAARTPGVKEVEGTAAPTPGVGEGPRLPPIFARSVKVEGADIVYVDRTGEQPVELTIGDLNLDIRNFSLQHPFTVLLDAAILSEARNLHATGEAAFQMATMTLILKQFVIETDLGTLPLTTLAQLSELKKVPLPERLEGKVDILIHELEAGPKGLVRFGANVDWTDGAVSLKEAIPGISFAVTGINANLAKINLANQPFTFNISLAYTNPEPNIKIGGTGAFDLATRAVMLKDTKVDLDLNTLSLEDMKASLAPLAAVPLPQTLKGGLEINIKELNAGPQGVGHLALDLDYTGGAIAMTNVAPGISFAAQEIDLALRDFSLTPTQPFGFKLSMALLNTEPNIRLEGAASFDQTTRNIGLSDTVVDLNLSKLSLPEIKKNLTMLEKTPLPEVLEGVVKITVKSLDAGPAGLAELAADVELTDVALRMANAAPGVSVDLKDLDLTLEDVSIDGKPFKFGLAAAYLNDVQNIAVEGTAGFTLAAQALTINNTDITVDLGTLSLSDLKSQVALLEAMPFPNMLKGKLNVALNDFSAGPKGLTSLLADVSLTDGEVDIPEVASGLGFAASDIDLKADDLSLSGTPFKVDLKAAYLNATQNIDFNGIVGIDRIAKQVTLTKAGIGLDLSTFQMDELRSLSPNLKDVPLPEYMKGTLSIAIVSLTASDKGLGTVDGTIDLKDGAIKLKELNVPIDQINTSVVLSGTTADIPGLTFKLGKGSVNAKAHVDQYMTARNFSVDATIEAIDLAQILNQAKQSVKVAGVIVGNVKAQGSAADLNAVTGTGAIEIQDGMLVDLNVSKLVFEKLELIPGLQGVTADLPEEYRAHLQEKDTRFEKIAIPFTVGGGTVNVDPFLFQAAEFGITGPAVIGFDQSYGIDGKFYIPTQLSSLIMGKNENMVYLQNADTGQIEIPLHINGKGAGTPNVDLKETVGGLLKNAIKSKGKQELKNLLGDVLRKEGIITGPPQQAPQTEGPDGSAPAESPQSPEGVIVDEIFKIFGQ